MVIVFWGGVSSRLVFVVVPVLDGHGNDDCSCVIWSDRVCTVGRAGERIA